MEHFRFIDQPISIPIPQIFYPFLEDKPFEECLICGRGLLEPNVQYVIDKAYRGTEVIVEYAICVSCCQNMHQEMSKESIQRITAHIEERVDMEARFRQLFVEGGQDIEPWLSNCVLTKTPREEAHSYQIHALFEGEKLMLIYNPMMICEAGLLQIQKLLSKKTREAFDDFTDRYLCPSSEYENLFDDSPLVFF